MQLPVAVATAAHVYMNVFLAVAFILFGLRFVIQIVVNQRCLLPELIAWVVRPKGRPALQCLICKGELEPRIIQAPVVRPVPQSTQRAEHDDFVAP